MDEMLTLRMLDPELSFGIESIGRKKKFLVDQDKNIIVFSEDMWALGAKAYDMCCGTFDTMTIPCTLQNHNKNLQECGRILDGIVEHMQEYARKGFIQDDEGKHHSDNQISSWSKQNYKKKLKMVDSYFSTLSDLSDEDSYHLGINLFFYGVMHLLDQYIVLDLPYSDESEALFGSIKDILHLVETRAAIEKAVRKRAKSAVKARHEKTYQAKAELKEWHKNNRHEFLKPDGSLHQAEAAEHVCYVLKITTLKAKKVAEYMGEFEKDFKK